MSADPVPSMAQVAPAQRHERASDSRYSRQESAVPIGAGGRLRPSNPSLSAHGAVVTDEHV